ncbi:hypothetical protein BUALT_Bualt01G0046500 [Buddleja alternifolia]|uniref:Uncharacterized protein n=1 Tax=Buddleja alternifolia TaxID=168488 RepID=A0AAV6YCB8_9LAMI|nr:hypothetical protein BUALT_Bualt01G0046500 [Buddleja alternifolia]
MVNSEKQQSGNDPQIDDGDRADQMSNGEDSINFSSGGAETSVSANQSVTRRLTEIFVEDGDGDLLMQRSDREDGVLQWLSALDMQVMGACRADERLKPLLKLNVETGVAEDRLLAHLSQHFEPSEVGMLARCLCIPLVSVRVGKINKQGTLLSPASTRGNLCLTLLPTSDLRISFNGDDGTLERLATLSTDAQCTAIEIEEIPADKSGRSFSIKTSDSMASYFWCSEKSKLLGDELLKKMKDLLMRKPSLTELTGISESRLNCFATHLRAYLSGSMVTSAQASGVLSATSSSDDSIGSSELRYPQSSFNSQKSSRFHSLSPRSSSFKEGPQKSLPSLRTIAREKFKRRGENLVSSIDGLSLVSSNNSDPSNSNSFQKEKLLEANGPALNFLDVFGKSSQLPLPFPEIQVPSSGPSHYSPHYCWCPPIGNLQLPISSTESLSLPPFSSLLTSKTSLNLAELPPLDFPNLLPEPFVRLPTSQQIPTFTPLICDPIVHIPVIEVCSSGQGYLVSAGPSMSTTIPSLNPNLMDPLRPTAESAVEKGARDTLRMLINNSNQPNPQLLGVFPSILSSSNDKQNLLAAGLYSGTRDVDAITNMGLILLSDKSMGGGFGKRCASRDNLIDQQEKPSSSGSSSFDEGLDRS